RVRRAVVPTGGIRGPPSPDPRIVIMDSLRRFGPVPSLVRSTGHSGLCVLRPARRRGTATGDVERLTGRLEQFGSPAQGPRSRGRITLGPADMGLSLQRGRLPGGPFPERRRLLGERQVAPRLVQVAHSGAGDGGGN